MAKKITLFSLQTFSSTGGIQKMTRTLAYSLYKLSRERNWDFELHAVYDKDSDLIAQYIPPEKFKGYGANRAAFIIRTLLKKNKPDVVMISHINLASVGLLIKAVHPGSRTWLIAHGIEVWRPLGLLKKYFIKHCDRVVCVSHFTRDQIISRHGVDPARCEVLNNIVDPFIKLPVTFGKPPELLRRYRLNKENPVIFTLTRLASTEQYKGHDHVIEAIARLKGSFPGLKYVLAGQYDPEEEARIRHLITRENVENEVILTGFIAEEELTGHFLMADLFVLPSKKEGFGIVFIEALACGLPVICGNADGSLDAICQGKLGIAVDADNIAELASVMAGCLRHPLTTEKRLYLQQECMRRFNEDIYRYKLENMLS